MIAKTRYLLPRACTYKYGATSKLKIEKPSVKIKKGLDILPQNSIQNRSTYRLIDLLYLLFSSCLSEALSLRDKKNSEQKKSCIVKYAFIHSHSELDFLY